VKEGFNLNSVCLYAGKIKTRDEIHLGFECN